MRDDFHQLVLQLGACECVECAKRLIEQQHFRLHGQCACDTNTLLHATGDFVRQLELGVREADKRQRIMRALRLHRARLRGTKYALDRKMHVAETGEPRQQRVVLKHDAAIGTGAGDLAPGAQQQPGGRFEKSGDEIQQRRFAAARMADQCDELAFLHREVDVTQGNEWTTFGPERHADVFDVHIFGRRGRRFSMEARNGAVGVGHWLFLYA